MAQALVAPLPSWSSRTRFWILTLSAAAVMLVAIWYAVSNNTFWMQQDAIHYLQLARGDKRVLMPFASRQLGPLVVKAMASLLHWPVERAFLLEGYLSLLVFVAITFRLLGSTAIPTWMPAALVPMIFWRELFLGLALPDLWYGALVSIFLLLLWQQRFVAASLLLLPLAVSRESTALLTVCYLFAGWKRIGWKNGILALAANFSAILIVKRLTIDTVGNSEHLPQAVYLAAKAPWNFIRNVLGVNPWSNVYPALCTTPVWKHAVGFGNVKEIGVCSYSINAPLVLFTRVMLEFGLFPLLFGFLWWHRKKFLERSVLLRFCLIYGCVSFLMTPLLGTAFGRLVAYSWPLFLIGLPLLFNEIKGTTFSGWKPVNQLLFLALHVVACIVPFWGSVVGYFLIELAIYIAGFLLLRSWKWTSSSAGLNEGSELRSSLSV